MSRKNRDLQLKEMATRRARSEPFIITPQEEADSYSRFSFHIPIRRVRTANQNTRPKKEQLKIWLWGILAVLLVIEGLFALFG